MALKLCKLFAFHLVNLMFRPFFTLQALPISSKKQSLAVASFRKNGVSRFVTKNAQVIVDYSKRFQKTLRKMSLYILFFRRVFMQVAAPMYFSYNSYLDVPYFSTTLCRLFGLCCFSSCLESDCLVFQVLDQVWKADDV